MLGAADEVVDIRDPDWSPDGGWIAFSGAAGEDARAAIYLVRPDGRDLVRLTPELARGHEADVVAGWDAPRRPVSASHGSAANGPP